MKMLRFLNIDYSGNRIYGLDILRAVAIISVLYGHFRHTIENYINIKLYYLFLLDGVTIFFVLSGFLIGGILIKIIDTTSFAKKDLWNFWIRRWYRTLPNYLLILSFLIVMNFFVYGKPPINWYYYFFFLQNFFKLIPSSFFPESWSLSVEEWFYLIIPSLIWISLKITKHRRECILFWIIAIITISTSIRIYKAFILNCNDIICWVTYLRQLVVTRLDSMMFGFLAAYTLFYKKEIFNKHIEIKFYVGIFLILIPQLYDFIFEDMFFKNYLSFSMTSVGTMLLLPKLCTIKRGSGFIHKFITRVSLTSYSMYLTHYSVVYLYVFMIFEYFFPGFSSEEFFISFLRYLLLWVFTILFSTLLYKYFELPIMKMRDKYGS